MKYETKCRANKSERDTLTLYPKGGAKGKNIREIYSAGRSIRIPIGLINRSIRPMVSSFRRSKCLSVELDTRHFRGGSSSTTIFTYAFSSMLFCAPLVAWPRVLVYTSS